MSSVSDHVRARVCVCGVPYLNGMNKPSPADNNRLKYFSYETCEKKK